MLNTKPASGLLTFPRFGYYVASTMLAFKRRKLERIPKFGKPYRQRFFGDPLHVCFGCSHSNPKGLKLNFYESDLNGLGFLWTPEPGLESFPNILQGGVSGTLLDELGGVLIQAKMDRFAFTVSSRLHFQSAVYADKPVRGHARILRTIGRNVLVQGELFTEEGKILSSMVALYFIPSRKQFQHVTKTGAVSPAVDSYLES